MYLTNNLLIDLDDICTKIDVIAKQFRKAHLIIYCTLHSLL